MKHFRWDKKYLYWGVTAFVVIAAAIVFAQLVGHVDTVAGALGALVDILSPFVWGLVISYLLYPLQRIYQRALFLPLGRLLYRKNPCREERANRFARGFSVFLSIFTLILLLTGLIWMVAPQLYNSIENIIVNSSEYISKLDTWITTAFKDYPELERAVSSAVGDMSNGIVNWASKFLLPRMSGLLASITTNVVNVAKSVYNIAIGLIVSVYVLYNRETFTAHCKKILYAVFSLETAAKLLDGLRFTNQVFMGFLSGKVLDSLIIGIICYFGCLILGMPYTLLVAVIIGITNIIPFFGPFLGAIPSAIIILTDSPLKMLIFVVFVIILQQFDGNILGPRILGNSVGVNGFWIMFSIILGAGIFGFIGMVIGVPVFVVIYTLLSNAVRSKLEQNSLPTETKDYMRPGYLDPETKKPTDWPPEPAGPSSKKRNFKLSFKRKSSPKKEDSDTK